MIEDSMYILNVFHDVNIIHPDQKAGDWDTGIT